METNRNNHDDTNRQDNLNDLNANSAYSGSGSWQPGGGTGEAGKLSENDDADSDIQNVSGNQAKQQHTPENPDEAMKPKNGQTFAESTDPSKLSDI